MPCSSGMTSRSRTQCARKSVGMIASQIWLTCAPASDRPMMQPSPDEQSRRRRCSSLAKVIAESGREVVVEREVAHRRRTERGRRARAIAATDCPTSSGCATDSATREHVPAQRDRPTLPGRARRTCPPGRVGVELVPSLGRGREHLAERGDRRERRRISQRHQLADRAAGHLRPDVGTASTALRHGRASFGGTTRASSTPPDRRGSTTS